MKIFFPFFLLSSCGSHLVIDGTDHFGRVVLGNFNQESPQIIVEKRIGQLGGHLGKRNYVPFKNSFLAVTKMQLTTYHSLKDFFFSLIPFYSSRSVILWANISDEDDVTEDSTKSMEGSSYLSHKD